MANAEKTGFKALAASLAVLIALSYLLLSFSGEQDETVVVRLQDTSNYPFSCEYDESTRVNLPGIRCVNQFDLYCRNYRLVCMREITAPITHFLNESLP